MKPQRSSKIVLAVAVILLSNVFLAECFVTSGGKPWEPKSIHPDSVTSSCFANPKLCLSVCKQLGLSAVNCLELLKEADTDLSTA